MPNDGERIAANYERILALRDDVREMKREQERTRKRLHDLEGVAGVLVSQEKQRREESKKREDAFKLWLAILTVAVAAAAIITPFLYHAAGVG